MAWTRTDTYISAAFVIVALALFFGVPFLIP